MNTENFEQAINYGQKLKLAREALGLTQEKVAEYLGLGPRYISDIERNKTKGSIDTLIKLCNIYNSPINFKIIIEVISHILSLIYIKNIILSVFY